MMANGARAAEIDELEGARGRVDDVVRLEIKVTKATGMHVNEGSGHIHGHMAEPLGVQPLLQAKAGSLT